MNRIDLGGNGLVYVLAYNCECIFWPAYHVVVPVLALGLAWLAVRAFWRATGNTNMLRTA